MKKVKLMKKLVSLGRITSISHLCVGLGLLIALQASTALAAPAQRVDEAIWVHDELYGTIGTDTNFKSPPEHSTDVIFAFMDDELGGQHSVAEYAPGDPEYNGGRWDLMTVIFTDAGREYFDTNGDGLVDSELTNAEDVLDAAEMGLLVITEPGVYFECPLRPRPSH